MKKSLVILSFLLIPALCSMLLAQTNAPAAGIAHPAWVLVIHGGAGGSVKGTMPADKEKAYLEKLKEAMLAGSAILSKGGSSLDAVEAVVKFMEDCPLFNAGKGAVLNAEGKAELDASIMDGKSGLAGAVACVTTIRNPIVAARAVMEQSKHVMLIGDGAEQFARSHGLEMVDPSYFITGERLDAWEKSKPKPKTPEKDSGDVDGRKGTVGAVALDVNGNLAAATSTGGMMHKMPGRVGDTPVIGAGTYASNQSCAVSCTGHGEYFIRNAVAYDVSALMLYKGMTLADATGFIIFDKLKAMNASGGLIAVDKDGNIAMPFNTNAMFRGFADASGRTKVSIY